MAQYRQCDRCGCTMDCGEGLEYPGVGLVCEECSQELETLYRKRRWLSKNRMAGLTKDLSASPS